MTLPEVQDFSRRSDNKTLMIYNDRLENAASRLAAMADTVVLLGGVSDGKEEGREANPSGPRRQV